MGDENFFMIKIQSDFPDAITIIGLPPTSDILRSLGHIISYRCRHTLRNRPQKHGEFVSKFELSDRLFLEIVPFRREARAYFMMAEVFQCLLNEFNCWPYCSRTKFKLY